MSARVSERDVERGDGQGSFDHPYDLVIAPAGHALGKDGWCSLCRASCDGGVIMYRRDHVWPGESFDPNEVAHHFICRACSETIGKAVAE